ncbi:MAG: galactose-1-phosphate uridylyltransferase, partial [Pseudomonadota bacterium]|nr:galactose-1-phosphate uridylyltransferase [Pseudomonadota bacterium]
MRRWLSCQSSLRISWGRFRSLSVFDPEEYPHRRLNALTGDWVLVSPHRTQRPWQGKEEPPSRPTLASYDTGCYLCPGNERAGGQTNPDYSDPYVFQNDFSALLLETPEGRNEDHDLLVAESETGICHVICFSPHHDLTLSEMSVAEIHAVVDLWTSQFAELGAMEG